MEVFVLGLEPGGDSEIGSQSGPPPYNWQPWPKQSQAYRHWTLWDKSWLVIHPWDRPKLEPYPGIDHSPPLCTFWATILNKLPSLTSTSIHNFYFSFFAVDFVQCWCWTQVLWSWASIPWPNRWPGHHWLCSGHPEVQRCCKVRHNHSWRGSSGR